VKAAAVDILVKYLEQEGVEYIFGVPGGHLLPLYDAVYNNGRIQPILARHEQGAAFMAYGYAATSGKIGVCCATVGPGATNLVTGVASAYVDSVPMLALTAQVGTTIIGKGGLQEGAGLGRTINQVALFDGITKFSTLALRGETLPHTVRRALRVALSGRRGPVHIDLPADVQAERVEDEIVPPSHYRPVGRAGVDADVLEAAAEHLKSASKPALLVGYGAMSSPGGRQRLLELAEKLQAPVATTLRAKGFFPEEHPLALGCLGLYGTRAANAYLKSGIDVLLAVGTSFHEFTSNIWDPGLNPLRALIQIDVDPAEIGKNYPATLSLVGDAEATLRSLLARLGDMRRSANGIREFKTTHEYFDEAVMYSDAMPIKPQRLMKELRGAVPRDAVVFVDIGNTIPWVERYFPIHSEGRFVVLSGLAAMGSAIAACIGGKLGAPDRPVVCLCGDGAFHMTGMEIATAAAHDIPITWVILKNNRLGMIYDVQSLSYQNRHIAATVAETDFVGLARALGANGYRAERPAEVAAVVREAIQSGKPSVVEVPIDHEELPPMKPRMAVMREPLGLPNPLKGVSLDTVKAVWRMARKR